MEDLEEVDVVRLCAEVLLEEEVDRALEHERVVDCNVRDALDTVPARLPAAGDGLVHHVVRDEEERLQLRGRLNESDIERKSEDLQARHTTPVPWT